MLPRPDRVDRPSNRSTSIRSIIAKLRWLQLDDHGTDEIDPLLVIGHVGERSTYAPLEVDHGCHGNPLYRTLEASQQIGNADAKGLRDSLTLSIDTLRSLRSIEPT